MYSKTHDIESHPLWVRGLKSNKALPFTVSPEVAPFMGAWIEIRMGFYTFTIRNVAPFMGAWIEIKIKLELTRYIKVAPFMGAWIEI